jgi:hypothetical protein
MSAIQKRTINIERSNLLAESRNWPDDIFVDIHVVSLLINLSEKTIRNLLASRAIDQIPPLPDRSRNCRLVWHLGDVRDWICSKRAQPVNGLLSTRATELSSRQPGRREPQYPRSS